MILLKTECNFTAMRLDKVRIQNFRGIEDLTMELHPQFNLLIGENGSGKTAILEALSVAIGAFFLGLPGVHSRGIRDEDIRYFKSIEGSYEWAANTRVEVIKGHITPHGEIEQKLENGFPWFKERSGITGRTNHGNRSRIKEISKDINSAIRNSKRTEPIDLPILAYYSTARLWKEGRENKKSKEQSARNLPTRYRGYKDALEIKSSFSMMLEWFKSKFQDLILNSETSFQLECVKNVIVKNIPNAKNIRWIFDKDKIPGLYITFDETVELPFYYLSDGYRNMLAIFADLAYRCVTLNPHFGADANLKSQGVVLIDELDLHLHPAWQQDIVKKLKNSFPRIQFVASTHSPFILQEMEDNEVYKINSTADNILQPLKGLNRLGVEDIAEDVQGVETPNMSSKREEMFKTAEEYYKLLDSAENENNREELQRIKDKLDSLAEKYSDDVAYYAFLKQERLTRGIK
jgi:predicted ATP-binding protein involved in virulence